MDFGVCVSRDVYQGYRCKHWLDHLCLPSLISKFSLGAGVSADDMEHGIDWSIDHLLIAA